MAPSFISSLSSTGSGKETYYTILEINNDATIQEIKDSYKHLAMLRHPDKNLGDAAKACAAFQKLQAAYSNLSDPLSRAKYDNSLNVLDLDFDMTSESSPPPSSTRSDFSDDDDDDGDIETPAPPPTPGPESFEAKYFNQNNNNDDDNGQEWHTKAWLEDAIRESIRKIIEYNKRMGVLAAAAATAVGEEEEKGEEENCPIEWDELRGKMWREMRYQEMLRRDLK